MGYQTIKHLTLTETPDYYVVMAAYGDWCNDPMRIYSDAYTPTRKYKIIGIYSTTLLPMCISSEEDDDRRYMNSAELFVKYGHGPGCILIYCDNMWDPCMLNMQSVSIRVTSIYHIFLFYVIFYIFICLTPQTTCLLSVV